MPQKEKNYLTPLGHKRLQNERDFLLKKARPAMVKLVSWAASLGDRSENADYQYGKKRLREIDRRLEFLHQRLDQVEEIDPCKQNSKRIQFGATVKLQLEDRQEKRSFSLVGVDETDPKLGLISWKSPIGSALLGKSLGDQIQVKTPSGLDTYTVLEILYHHIAIPPFVEPPSTEWEKN